MSAELPEILDAWRMVAGRREFEGRAALSALSRLRDALSDAEGEVEFALAFDHDALRVPYLELKLAAELPLQCQRTLQRFLFPVRTVQRLGLIRDEADEAALPPGYEALLVPASGEIRPLELVEDELILAIPVVPVKPGTEAVERDWPVPPEEQAAAQVAQRKALGRDLVDLVGAGDVGQEGVVKDVGARVADGGQDKEHHRPQPVALADEHEEAGAQHRDGQKAPQEALFAGGIVADGAEHRPQEGNHQHRHGGRVGPDARGPSLGQPRGGHAVKVGRQERRHDRGGKGRVRPVIHAPRVDPFSMKLLRFDCGGHLNLLPCRCSHDPSRFYRPASARQRRVAFVRAIPCRYNLERRRPQGTLP